MFFVTINIMNQSNFSILDEYYDDYYTDNTTHHMANDTLEAEWNKWSCKNSQAPINDLQSGQVRCRHLIDGFDARAVAAASITIRELLGHSLWALRNDQGMSLKFRLG